MTPPTCVAAENSAAVFPRTTGRDTFVVAQILGRRQLQHFSFWQSCRRGIRKVSPAPHISRFGHQLETARQTGSRPTSTEDYPKAGFAVGRPRRCALSSDHVIVQSTLP